MTTFFTSDLHLGHQAATKFRNFDSIDEHDCTIVENINKVVTKRDKLFILGDLAFSRSGLKWARNIQCQNIELILGNHDLYPITEYLSIVQKIHGFKGYKDHWLSHCPIHPQELYRAKGNIHGHIHATTTTGQPEDPRYINVNVDMNNYQPISYENILARLT